jgi:protein-S-isoprenylcysteine O-methyltransferase Ste14
MWFKAVFVLAFAYAATVATLTARRAARRHGDTVNQLTHEVPALVAVRAALGIVFYAALIAWLFWSDRFAWSYVPIPLVWRWFAAILFVPVLAFFTWSVRTLGTNYRGGVGLYAEHELVTHGPYRRLRHPIYTAFIAIMILVWVMTANWILGASGLALVVSIAVVRIPIEERELEARFGRER